MSTLTSAVKALNSGFQCLGLLMALVELFCGFLSQTGKQFLENVCHHSGGGAERGR